MLRATTAQTLAVNLVRHCSLDGEYEVTLIILLMCVAICQKEIPNLGKKNPAFLEMAQLNLGTTTANTTKISSLSSLRYS